MNHPKTTVTGYLVLGASLLSLVAKAYGGGMDVMAIQDLLGALAGVGLVSASDGAH